MRKLLLFVVAFLLYRFLWHGGGDIDLKPADFYVQPLKRTLSTLSCNQGQVKTSAGTESCVCDPGWYTIPEGSPLQCNCNVNCAPTGTKSCNSTSQICICKSGYGTSPNQNPKSRIYCNVQYANNNVSSSSSGNGSQSNSSGQTGFNLSGLNLPTILLALVCLGIGAAIVLFCCCLGSSLFSHSRAY